MSGEDLTGQAGQDSGGLGGQLDEDLLQLLAGFNAAVAATRLYAVDHPQTIQNLERAYLKLKNLLRDRSEITLIVVDEQLIVDCRVIGGRSPHQAQFARLLKERGIERFTVAGSVTFQELSSLTLELASGAFGTVTSSAAIKLGKVQLPDSPSDQGIARDALQRIEQLNELQAGSLEELKTIYRRFQGFQDIEQAQIAGIVQKFAQGILADINPLMLLADLKTSDEYTFTHAINVCILTMSQAEALNVDEQLLHDIGIAAALHDTGKMFVPDHILNKRGKLDDLEWETMRRHTIHGARSLLRVEGLTKLAFIGALEHHIRYDGSGYPRIHPDWRPCMVSQMIAIADLFDAMRSRRPYQEAKPESQIIAVLEKESGTSFDPLLVKNFLQLLKN